MSSCLKATSYLCRDNTVRIRVRVARRTLILLAGHVENMSSLQQ